MCKHWHGSVADNMVHCADDAEHDLVVQLQHELAELRSSLQAQRSKTAKVPLCCMIHVCSFALSFTGCECLRCALVLKLGL